MSRLLIASLLVLALSCVCHSVAYASEEGHGLCYYGLLGQAIDCGGGYVVPSAPPAHHEAPPPVTPPKTPTQPIPSSSKTPALVPYISSGPGGRCWAVGPAHPAPDVTVTIWQNSLHLGACYLTAPAAAAAPHHAAPAPAAQPPPGPDPAELALQYWKTIPLPRPHPSIPPGYAICGKPVYLVTDGTTAPGTYNFSTPLGPLSITAHGAYTVDWGDPAAPGWTGPYPFEGQPWPVGRIVHTYDDAGRVAVAVRENWTATWTLGGDGGTLTGLATGANFNYPVYQLQSIVTEG